MRRLKTAVIAVVGLAALSATIIRAQQQQGRGRDDAPALDPMAAARGPRQLMRNGMDYLNDYKDDERALTYLLQAQVRQGELSGAEQRTLREAIETARRNLRSPANPPGQVARKSADSVAPRPGAIALAVPPEPIQLVGGGAIEGQPAPAPMDLDAPAPAAALKPAPVGEPETLGASAVGNAAEPLPPLDDAPAAQPAPAVERPAPVVAEPPAPAEPPALMPAPEPAVVDAPVAPAMATVEARPSPSLVADEPQSPPTSAPAPPDDALPPIEDVAPPPALSIPAMGRRAAPASASSLTDRPSSLPPHLQREVERVAERQDLDARRDRRAAQTPVDPIQVNSSRLELPRAPSPTEARPLRAIPVPEEFVPLAPRQWEANRKMWAAAATCHGPLYFQDAVLERYGQGIEQAAGPIGRYLSYPLDDPTQSNARNQIFQPFYGMGKFVFQIAALPYHLIVDPPNEPEYDLGYYRPGDRIPAGTFYIPKTGVGPPLRGRNY